MSQYTVLPLLLLAEDHNYSQSEESSMLVKLSMGMSVIGAFFHTELLLHEFSSNGCTLYSENPITFPLPLNLKLISQLDLNTLWGQVATLIHSNKKLWSRRRKYVGFLPHPIKISSSHGGLGGGGFALLPLNKILDLWPNSLEDLANALKDEREVLAENYYGRSVSSKGWFLSASLGALAHELAHTFELGHTEDGLMGPEFYNCIRERLPRQIFLNPSSAALLYFSKWFFNNNPREDGDPTIPQLHNSYKLTSEIGLGAYEVRCEGSEVVVSGMVFYPSLKEVKLSKKDVPLQCSEGHARLIVIDIMGNILKESISRNSLPHALTNIVR